MWFAITHSTEVYTISCHGNTCDQGDMCASNTRYPHQGPSPVSNVRTSEPCNVAVHTYNRLLSYNIPLQMGQCVLHVSLTSLMSTSRGATYNHSLLLHIVHTPSLTHTTYTTPTYMGYKVYLLLFYLTHPTHTPTHTHSVFTHYFTHTVTQA